jgi:hypothetical protein
MGERHLDTERIAAYAEGRLPAPERADVEAHLADCESCRHEASSVAILLRRDRRRRRLLVGGPVALAAVLTLAVFMRSGNSGLAPDPGGLRPGGDSTREGVTAVEALRPAPGAEVSPDSLRFAWRRVGGDALYLFVLTDQAGETIWESRTADSTLSLPPSVSLRRGELYIWLVDVLLRDGTMASTGPREFRLPR